MNLNQMSKMAAIRCTLAYMLVRFGILVLRKLNAGSIVSVMVDQVALQRSKVTNSIYVEAVVETNAADGQRWQNVKKDAQAMV